MNKRTYVTHPLFNCLFLHQCWIYFPDKVLNEMVCHFKVPFHVFCKCTIIYMAVAGNRNGMWLFINRKSFLKISITYLKNVYHHRRRFFSFTSQKASIHFFENIHHLFHMPVVPLPPVVDYDSLFYLFNIYSNWPSYWNSDLEIRYIQVNSSYRSEFV